MFNEEIVKVIDFWNASVIEKRLTERTITGIIDTESKEIIDIIGPRRSGKSTLLKLLIKKLNLKKNFMYINFEDPFFIERAEPTIINELIDTYIHFFSPDLKYLFFDEIQNITHWEKSLRILRDNSDYKIFITGSSSKLLSSELSTLISGLHLSYQLYPFDFNEFIKYHRIEVERLKDYIVQKTIIEKNLVKYLLTGGFPEVVITEKEVLLKQYYTDIIYRDIVARYEVRQKAILEKMGIFLLSNIAKPVSMASLQKTFEISFELACTYFEYFKDAFLIFDLPSYSHSLKTQQKTLKKIYAVDTGLANIVSFHVSDDYGRLLENLVFLHLKRIFDEVYYYKTCSNLEVDFYVRKKNHNQLIQVCYDFTNEKTHHREITALIQAMNDIKINTGLIITMNQKEDIARGEHLITVIPVAEWILTRLYN
ncbi:MAG: ATP-binding protein [Bacteroidia bacterium]|nr:ATP-binding protein [Bacteroidia bacterium]